mmetsp:Transcript_7096/g.16607  ORF Transcript_7096/g.16607 Transcript_7096/m.16607 type:complete len:211 (-) Transcript_7096:50-682(-)|eukprot:CAMPEP_0113630448 /NCGR_PEP_ID=MMETSP0017_2-20120614/15818_1 /TAXON_ID=2856 /ORGANISM="Cylindrotheca closterium" /LENGTH=210 /DNA_ID=CAMNT_0000540909 /DNA_START=186 /DNA_END=818 /DNA_ORIENTATION=- /assembly_acc=CAM_ASM_000147
MGVEKVVELNNRAVALLDGKHFQKAIQTASFALKQFQGHRRENPEAVAVRQNACIDQSMLARNVGGHSDDDVIEEFIYHNGIILPSTVSDCALITSALVFNTALAHQLLASAMDPQDNLCHSLLRKAKALYKVAYNEQVEGILIKFAIINNIGVIYRWLGEEDELARECFDFLVSLTMSLAHTGSADLAQHMCGFWANVEITNKKLAPAA